MRRILAALAAMTVLTFGSIVWAQPAHAAPNTGACSLEEWRNPASVSDCVKRGQQSLQNQTGCVTAPTPGSPTSGMAGSFTSRPESSLRDGVGGQYSTYGVGGYGLDTYDIGCLGTVKHPTLVGQNTIASAEFGIAASIIAASNGLRELAYNPGAMWDWSDQFVEAATHAVYTYIFTPFGGVMLAIVGIFLMWRARQGEMSQALRMTAWALFVMVAVTGVAQWPVAAANGADSAASTGLRVVHSVLGPGGQDIPADECVLGGEACKDNRSVATRSADVVADAVLYRNWLRAMLGDADTPTAQKYGPALFDATTLSWGEAARAEQSPELRKQLIDGKAAMFNTVAEQIRTEDSQAYEHLQGIHGGDRIGAGAVALLSAVAFAAFDMAASVVILFGFFVFRLAVVAFPLFGTVGLFMPASNGVRRILNMTVAAFINIVLFGAIAGIYLSAITLIFQAPLPGVGQLAAVAIVGFICLVIMYQCRKGIYTTATGRSRANDGVFVRAFKAGKTLHGQQGTPTGQGQPVAGGEQQPRPEGSSTAARARLVAGVVAPSLATVAESPYVTAVTGAVSSRPEATTADKARAVVGALATAAATAAAGPVAGAAAGAATTAANKRPENRS